MPKLTESVTLIHSMKDWNVTFWIAVFERATRHRRESADAVIRRQLSRKIDWYRSLIFV